MVNFCFLTVWWLLPDSPIPRLETCYYNQAPICCVGRAEKSREVNDWMKLDYQQLQGKTKRCKRRKITRMSCRNHYNETILCRMNLRLVSGSEVFRTFPWSSWGTQKKCCFFLTQLRINNGHNINIGLFGDWEGIYRGIRRCVIMFAFSVTGSIRYQVGFLLLSFMSPPPVATLPPRLLHFLQYTQGCSVMFYLHSYTSSSRGGWLLQ